MSDIDGAKKLGVEKKDIYSSMEKSAIARKYQEIYAGLDNADITDYDFSGGRYEKLLEKNNYKIKEKENKRAARRAFLGNTAQFGKQIRREIFRQVKV